MVRQNCTMKLWPQRVVERYLRLGLWRDGIDRWLLFYQTWPTADGAKFPFLISFIFMPYQASTFMVSAYNINVNTTSARPSGMAPL